MPIGLWSKEILISAYQRNLVPSLGAPGNKAPWMGASHRQGVGCQPPEALRGPLIMLDESRQITESRDIAFVRETIQPAPQLTTLAAGVPTEGAIPMDEDGDDLRI